MTSSINEKLNYQNIVGQFLCNIFTHGIITQRIFNTERNLSSTTNPLFSRF